MPILSAMRAVGGNARLAEFYQRHYDLVRSTAWKSGATHYNVDDIIQETFLIARPHLVGGELIHTGWIVKAARLVTLNSLRGERRRLRREFHYFERHGRSSSSEERTQQLLAQHLLEGFLQEQPPKQRMVFMLTEFGGFSSPEIGELMSLKPTTIRSLRKRAMRDFNKTFSESSRELVMRQALRRDCPNPTVARRSGAMFWFVCGGSSSSLGTHWGMPSSKVALAGCFKQPALTAIAAFGVAVTSAASIVAQVRDEPATRSALAPIAETRAHLAMRPLREQPPRAQLVVPSPAPVASDTTPSEEPGESRSRTLRKPAQARRGIEPKPSLDEYRVLAAARQLMVDGKSVEVLGSLSRRRSWSDLTLEKKALYLEIGALCELGRVDEARARAASWRELHPRHALDPRVERLCW